MAAVTDPTSPPTSPPTPPGPHAPDGGFAGPTMPTTPAGGDDPAAREVRCSASYPLPQLRPVPDFVGMPSGRRYVTVQSKFVIAQVAAAGWTAIAVAISLAFAQGLASLVSWPYAVILLASAVWVPAYLAAFNAITQVLDDPPALKILRPGTPVTVLIPVLDERTALVATLAYLAAQDYDGALRVLVVDRGSVDDTAGEARRAAVRLGIDVDVLTAPGVDRASARNAGLARISTPVLVAVEPGAYLHPSAVRLLVARLSSSPTDTALVAGDAVVRNHRDGSGAELLAGEYALGANAVQRVNALFQGALVAEGACSVFRTDAVRSVNGWATGAAQDVQLTWRLLERGWRVFHEPLALAFTTERITIASAARRRARHAWGLLAALHEPGRRPLRFPFSRFLTAVDVATPVLDLVFTIAWVQAVVFLAFGQISLVGFYALFVLPLSLAAPALVRRYQRDVLDEAGLAVARRGGLARFAPLLWTQAVQAPVGVWSELREIQRLRDEGPDDVTQVPLRVPRTRSRA
jgi:poly-beta-1,6-N-acetyl-D-glucosamine synthase